MRCDRRWQNVKRGRRRAKRWQRMRGDIQHMLQSGKQRYYMPPAPARAQYMRAVRQWQEPPVPPTPSEEENAHHARSENGSPAHPRSGAARAMRARRKRGVMARAATRCAAAIYCCRSPDWRARSGEARALATIARAASAKILSAKFTPSTAAGICTRRRARQHGV